MNIFLSKAANWFIDNKAPDLRDKVNLGLSDIIGKRPLEQNYKKLFGFILFDYSMHHGPLSFLEASEAAIETGVLPEMEEYAKDWISHSKKTKE